MKARGQTIKFLHGDVRELRIYRRKGAFRLAIYDEDSAVPLIQAMPSAAERRAIRKALEKDK